ncbi:hypothetical protein [Polluticoccus soli]|uniref:hypothetical protein n=1 Tax=Polluticoccus soli TaxID=3034150 RepID=UPI0023E20FC6|nr:hypothetical protein [Flavipsychrobacter sp. JY13-12]
MHKQIDLQKIEQSPDYISGYDAQLNVVIWNQAIASKYNIAKADAIGRNIIDLFPFIVGDFRLQCLLDSISEKKMFFFSALPYTHEDRIYTQLIIPGKEEHNFQVLSVVRDHKRHNELYLRTDLLDGISTQLPLSAE